jgi:very-short-patch-repair endonuclease
MASATSSSTGPSWRGWIWRAGTGSRSPPSPARSSTSPWILGSGPSAASSDRPTALEIYDETPVFTRSDLEKRFYEVVIAAGLPAPAMNRFVAGYEIDAYWAEARFGVELDVFGTHGSRLSFEEDRERDDELLLAGIETTRVTGARLDREPGAVVASVLRHLARRGGAGREAQSPPRPPSQKNGFGGRSP